MKNETRRRIANWLIKIPGFVETVDISENIKCAKAIAECVKHEVWTPIPPIEPVLLKEWQKHQSVETWARLEAKIAMDRIEALRNAKVEFKENTVSVTFLDPPAPEAKPEDKTDILAEVHIGDNDELDLYARELIEQVKSESVISEAESIRKQTT